MMSNDDILFHAWFCMQCHEGGHFSHDNRYLTVGILCILSFLYVLLSYHFGRIRQHKSIHYANKN
jgi:hypothetical protein